MPPKVHLGKGLGALIPGATLATASDGSRVLSCGIEELRPGRYQARKAFPPAEMQELADSIRKSGILQPILVRKIAGTKDFEIIAGERRWRAAQKVRLKEVPVIVRDLSDVEAAEASLLENLQREDLNPLEEAEAFDRLIEEFGNTHEILAQRLGKDRSTITNSLRLLKLSPFARDALSSGKISSGHARCLIGLTEQETREIISAIEKKGLSVRATEAMLQKKGRTKTIKKPVLATSLAGDLAQSLSSHLQTRVQVLLSSIHGKGKMVIAFSSNNELARIAALLRNEIK